MVKVPSTDELRDAIGRTLQEHVKSYRLADVCRELGIVPIPESEVLNSKWVTVLNWLTSDPNQVKLLACRVVERFPTYHLEELVWRFADELDITELTRRKIISELNRLPDPWGLLSADEVLAPVFPVRQLLTTRPYSLIQTTNGNGQRIAMRDIGNWNFDALTSELNLLQVSGRRFRMLLARLLDPNIRTEVQQREYADAINPHLRRCGWELRVAGEDTGLPVYQVLPIYLGVEGRPKNIIFASTIKPDLRFKDAVNNDIEVVTDAAKVLIYDRPIPPSGLLWRDLQDWWADSEGLDPESRNTKERLYSRLLSSLPKNSPPQKLLFRTFYKLYKDSFECLPALLPEVWLHYDPRTVAERGRDALVRQRMDFLMLFAHDVRVVIEVDGRQHYADDDGQANSSKYAKLAAADRELRLLGYEVYRFGAYELSEQSGEDTVRLFFEALLRRHWSRTTGTR